MSTHVNGTNWTCKNCDKVHQIETELSKHMLTHRNDGDWTCDDCAYQTNTMENLKKHIQTSCHKSRQFSHNPGKFNCNFCSEKFNNNCELERTDKATKHSNHSEIVQTVLTKANASSITMTLTRINSCAMSVVMNSRVSVN